MNRTTMAGIAAALTTSLLVMPSSATGKLANTPTGAPASSLEGLKVLLTNDDSAQGKDTALGTDGRGLYELRHALCAAGADVLVVAPWSQQSGAGGRITTPGGRPVPVTVQPVTAPASYADDCGEAPSGGAVYGVCVASSPCTTTSASASPSDAVLIGLSRVVPDNYWPEGPDVVVSGVNFGQNTGSLVNHSGTVGASVTAHESGIPTVAFSAEVSFADLTATPFPATSQFAVSLLGRLQDQDLLTPATALNVNYPFVSDDESLGRPTLTVTGTATDISFDYTGDVGAAGGTYQLKVGPPTAETRPRADTTAMRRNDIAITPLDGDWTAQGEGRRFERLVRGWRP